MGMTHVWKRARMSSAVAKPGAESPGRSVLLSPSRESRCPGAASWEEGVREDSEPQPVLRALFRPFPQSPWPVDRVRVKGEEALSSLFLGCDRNPGTRPTPPCHPSANQWGSLLHTELVTGDGWKGPTGFRRNGPLCLVGGSLLSWPAKSQEAHLCSSHWVVKRPSTKAVHIPLSLHRLPPFPPGVLWRLLSRAFVVLLAGRSHRALALPPCGESQQKEKPKCREMRVHPTTTTKTTQTPSELQFQHKPPPLLRASKVRLRKDLQRAWQVCAQWSHSRTCV